MIVEIDAAWSGMDEHEMSRVREVPAFTKENGSLTIQPDTEKHREVFLIWPIYDRNFNPQMGKSFNFI